jgi:hypothetical protein
MRSNPVVAKILSMPDPEKVKQLMGKKGTTHAHALMHATSSPFFKLLLCCNAGSMGKKLPFNWVAWSKAIPDIMMEAKLHKARQYPGIKRLLLESGNRTIAERKLSHRKKTPPEPADIRGMLVLYKGEWYGDNASGKMWMRVRKQLQQEEYERAQIEARARHRGKLVLVESDKEEEEEMVVEEVIEELIEEVDGGASGDDENEPEEEQAERPKPRRDFIISHVKDEHVTIAHNPDENDWIVQREREEEEERKRHQALLRRAEAGGRGTAVGAKLRQRPPSARRRQPAVFAAEALETTPHRGERQREATSAQTTYVPAEVFRERVKLLVVPAPKEEEVVEEIIEEVIEEIIEEEEEEAVVEDEAIEEEVIEEVIEEMVVDCLDMVDSEDSDDESDSADDSDSESSDASSEDDGY